MKVTPIGLNQTEVSLKNGTVVLFSYGTPVAALYEGNYFKTSYKWSKTTSAHINHWLVLKCARAEKIAQEFFTELTMNI